MFLLYKEGLDLARQEHGRGGKVTASTLEEAVPKLFNMLGSTLLITFSTHKWAASIVKKYKDRGNFIVVSLIWQIVTFV